MCNKIILITLIGIAMAFDNCDRTSPTEPLKLNFEPLPNPKISKIEREAELVYSPKKVKVFLGSRRAWVATTFERLWHISPTDVKSKIRDYPPNEREIRQWKLRKECNIKNDYYDWGSDANECWRDTYELNTWVKEKKLVKFATAAKMTKTACNMEWECLFYETTLYTDLNVKAHMTFVNVIHDISDHFILDVFGPNGKAFNLTFEQENFINLGRDSSAMVDPILKNQVSQLNVRVICFNSSRSSETCTIKCECDMDGEVMYVQMGKWNCLRNSCIWVNRPQKRNKRSEEDNKRPASIQDVKDLIMEQTFDEGEYAYNLLTLWTELEITRNVLLKTIQSMAKIDEQLIGQILEKPAVTEWKTPDIFLLHPCVDLLNSKTNCQSDHIYKGGRWIEKDKATEIKCQNPSKYRNISIFKPSELYIAEIVHKDPRGTSTSQDGWAWIQARREELDYASKIWRKDQASDTLGGLIADYNPFLGYGWSIANFATMGLSILAFLFSLAAFFRR